MEEFVAAGNRRHISLDEIKFPAETCEVAKFYFSQVQSSKRGIDLDRFHISVLSNCSIDQTGLLLCNDHNFHMICIAILAHEFEMLDYELSVTLEKLQGLQPISRLTISPTFFNFSFPGAQSQHSSEIKESSEFNEESTFWHLIYQHFSLFDCKYAAHISSGLCRSSRCRMAGEPPNDT